MLGLAHTSKGSSKTFLEEPLRFLSAAMANLICNKFLAFGH